MGRGAASVADSDRSSSTSTTVPSIPGIDTLTRRSRNQTSGSPLPAFAGTGFAGMTEGGVLHDCRHSRESGNPETRTILRHFAQHFMGKGLYTSCPRRLRSLPFPWTSANLLLRALTHLRPLLHRFHMTSANPSPDRHDRSPRIPEIGAPAHARRTRLPPPVHRPRRAGRGCRGGPDHGLRRVRRDGRFPARRQPRPDHAAAAHAAHRPPAHRPHGGRHHQDRGPVGQGREPEAAVRAAHRRQHRRHPARLRTLPRLRRRRGR